MFHYLNNQYLFSYFIPYGRWNITNYCWASMKAAFCCLGACSQFAQSKLTSNKTENGWARCELSASKEWATTEQAQPEQGHRKRALEPISRMCFGLFWPSDYNKVLHIPWQHSSSNHIIRIPISERHFFHWIWLLVETFFSKIIPKHFFTESSIRITKGYRFGSL